MGTATLNVMVEPFTTVGPTTSLIAQRPSRLLGMLTALAGVAIATLAIYPLSKVAPTVSLSVVYLPAVLLVSTFWGISLGLLSSLLSAAAFNFFHLPPVGEFTISDPRNWVALAAFTTVAAVASWIAELARARTLEAERRREEADLVATLARELLAGADTRQALGIAAHRIALALGLPAVAIQLGPADGDERRRAIALRDAGGHQVATLLVPRTLLAELDQRLREQVAPSLAAMVAIALRRDAVQREAVETAALRRSNDVKTALLRAVSHDLRSPLTAIVAAGHALTSSSLSSEDRTELGSVVVTESERLAALVDKLLDLSKLQGGGAAPRREWVSLEEVVLSARASLGPSGNAATPIVVNVEPDLPEINADAAQLERAFANLLENASRYAAQAPVSVNVARVGQKIVVNVIDNGPGILPAERDRIFEPFYRGRAAGEDRWTGSGLGLAIVKGFVEGNGGTITVQSLPGQGTCFTVSLPIEQPVPVGARR